MQDYIRTILDADRAVLIIILIRRNGVDEEDV